MSSEVDYLQSLGISALGTRIRRLFENLNVPVSQIYRESLSFEQRWFALTRLLDERDNLSVQSAADALGASHVSVLQVVKGMEGAGLLSRMKSTEDRRSTVLSLTEEGRRVAIEVRHISRQVDQAAFELLEEAAPQFLDSLLNLERALQRRSFAERLNEVFESRNKSDYQHD